MSWKNLRKRSETKPKTQSPHFYYVHHEQSFISTHIFSLSLVIVVYLCIFYSLIHSPPECLTMSSRQLTRRVIKDYINIQKKNRNIAEFSLVNNFYFALRVVRRKKWWKSSSKCNCFLKCLHSMSNFCRMHNKRVLLRENLN